MKLFDVKIKNTTVQEDGSLYLEAFPYNKELSHMFMRAYLYPSFSGSVDDYVLSELPSIREDLYNELSDELKEEYVNKQFKITNSILNPENIDYDILGFNKQRIIIKGELKQVNYYKNYTASSDTYSDLVVSEFRDYIRNDIGLVQYRNQTSNWIMNDNTTGLTLNFTKYYTAEEAIGEGIDRRGNMLAFAKTSLLDGLKAIYGEPLNQTYAFDMLTSVKTQMEYFTQGYTQPLRDAVSASTKAYLTTGIKEAIIEQLTF